MKQLSLFEERDYRVPRQEKIVINKDALVQWKQRIFEYQQSVKNSQQPQQQSLFELPSTARRLPP